GVQLVRCSAKAGGASRSERLRVDSSVKSEADETREVGVQASAGGGRGRREQAVVLMQARARGNRARQDVRLAHPEQSEGEGASRPSPASSHGPSPISQRSGGRDVLPTSPREDWESDPHGVAMLPQNHVRRRRCVVDAISSVMSNPTEGDSRPDEDEEGKRGRAGERWEGWEGKDLTVMRDERDGREVREAKEAREEPDARPPLSPEERTSASAASSPSTPIELTLQRLAAASAAAGIQAAARGRYARKASREMIEGRGRAQRERQMCAAHRLQAGWRGASAREVARGMASARAAAVGLGAADLCALRVHAFERLLAVWVEGREEAKRRASEREEFDAAKRHKLTLQRVGELSARLREREKEKRLAISHQDFEVAARIKRATDELRVLISRVLYEDSTAGEEAGEGRRSSPSLKREEARDSGFSAEAPRLLNSSRHSRGSPSSSRHASPRLHAEGERKGGGRAATSPPRKHDVVEEGHRCAGESSSSPPRRSPWRSPGVGSWRVGSASPPSERRARSAVWPRDQLTEPPPLLHARSVGLRPLAPEEAAVARPIIDTFGEQVASLFFSEKESLRQASLENVSDQLGTPELMAMRRTGLQVVGQMLSRVFSTDASALVVRAGVRLLRLLVSSTVGLTAGTELGRMVQRLLPSLLSRASEELFTQLETRNSSSPRAGGNHAHSEGVAAITDALRWLAQFPRVGAARLAADLLETDVKGATERLLLRRLLLLRQLLKLSPASTGGGVGEGRDSRLLPLSGCARFVASSYSRREARLRAVALSTVGALAEAALRASADEKRLLVGHLKVLNPSLLEAISTESLGSEEPRPPHDPTRRRDALELARKLESGLVLELNSLRTRVRQWEMRVKKVPTPAESHAIKTLRSELAEVVTLQEQAEAKLRHV
ncbi:MAG: hypothetical protein SGPRY_005187, partial [Prymnesium sp.]